MTAFHMSLIGISALFGLILLRIPIGFSLMLVGITGYATISGWSPALSVLATEPAASLSSVDLATVPLFLLMGTFATVAGFSADIYKVIAAFFGHRRGGLAYATVGASAVFGVVCGSSTATAATFGRSALPEMLNRGYDKGFAAGAIAAGGTLKSLIPPAVVMILYSMITNVFIFDLFIAAIVPALIAIVLNMLCIALITRYKPELAPISAKVNWIERKRALKAGLPALLLIVAVFGGLYSGVFTVNEAASVAAILALIASFARGRINKANFISGLRESASATAMLYIILIGAFVFGDFLNLANFPQALIKYVNQIHAPPLSIVFILLLIYLLLGAVLDEIAAVLITLPFVLPIVVSLGYDPVWWGIVSVTVMEIGMIIPPMGIIVFVLYGIARDIPLRTLYIGVAPYVIADIVLLVLVVLFPDISLGLLRFLH